MLVAKHDDLFAMSGEWGLPQIRDALRLLSETRPEADLESGVDGCIGADETWQARQSVSGSAAAALRSPPWLLGETLPPVLAGSRPLTATVKNSRTESGRRLVQLESASGSDGLLVEIVELARISDLRGAGVWPSDELKNQVKEEFEKLRKRIKDTQEDLIWNDEITYESAKTTLHLVRLACRCVRLTTRSSTCVAASTLTTCNSRPTRC